MTTREWTEYQKAKRKALRVFNTFLENDAISGPGEPSEARLAAHKAYTEAIAPAYEAWLKQLQGI